jgi:hypothetical protein
LAPEELSYDHDSIRTPQTGALTHGEDIHPHF